MRTLMGLALLVVVLASGCSSSTHAASKPAASSVPSATSSTAADLAQLQDICHESNVRLGDAARHAFGSRQPSAERWRPFMLQSVLPIIDQRLDAMSHTTAAAQLSSIAQAVDAGRAAIASAKKNPAQLDPSTRAPFDRYDDLVGAAGVPECAVGG